MADTRPERRFTRIDRLPPYVFNITAELKMAARRRGEDIIDFSMGNPDGATPPHIVEKLCTVAQRPDTHGYSTSRGIPRLRRAISRWYQDRYDVEIDPESEAIVTIGSKEGLAHLMLATLDHGDTVLVPNPSYPIHIYGAVIAGAQVRSVPLVEGVDFFNELERAIRESYPKPKMMILGFPSNPTAQCVELEFFEKVVALAKRYDVLVVHDLAYADIVYDGWKAPSIMQVPGARDVAVEFFTLSKSYNMAGWRIGFMVGNKTLVSALARIKSYHDYGTFTPLQVAAIAALEGDQQCVRDIAEQYKRRRDVLVKGLHEAGWMVEMPKASMYVWAKIPELFRVVQGLMAGPLIPLSQSLLLRNYPPEKRTFALALWSMTVIIAPICGPILGGYICDNFSWGWIFLINVPMGIVVLTLCLTLLKGRETETSPVKMNLPGLTLLVLGVGGLQIMLDKGRDLDWFNSSTIIILTVVSVISLISLVIWESTSENPILDLSLFKSRNFTIGIVSITCAYLFYSGAIVLMPQLLQETMGYNAIWAGLAYAPIGIMPLLISPLIGRYGNKIDMRVLVTFSFLMYAVCYYWRSVTFMPTIDFTGIIMPQFFQGFAVACFFLPLTTISFSGLPDNKFANASSMSNFFRTLSGSVGTSLTMTLWGRRESLHHSQLTATIDQFNPVFNSSSQIMDKYYGSLSGVLNEINNEITQQSLSISANEIFRMAAIAFILLTVLVWFAKPPFTAKGVG